MFDEPNLSVSIDARTAPGGEPVLLAGDRVRVEARLSGAGPASTGLRWRLFWETEGKGDTEAGVEAEGALAGGPSWSFEVAVPPGPWSYAGQLLKLHWFLEVTASSGAHAVDVETRVLVLPRDRADVLLGPPS